MKAAEVIVEDAGGIYSQQAPRALSRADHDRMTPQAISSSPTASHSQRGFSESPPPAGEGGGQRSLSDHQFSEEKRSFLRYAMFLAGGMVAIMSSWGVGRFVLFRTGKSKPREISEETLGRLRPGVPLHVPEAGAWLLKETNLSEILALDDRCTHLGCRPRWNPTRHVFECPCHGSEFASDGALLKGPATRPLPKLGLRKRENGIYRLVVPGQ